VNQHCIIELLGLCCIHFPLNSTSHHHQKFNIHSVWRKWCWISRGITWTMVLAQKCWVHGSRWSIWNLATYTLAYKSAIKSNNVNICPILPAEKWHIRWNALAIWIASQWTSRPPTFCITGFIEENKRTSWRRGIISAALICGSNCKRRKSKGREYELGEEHGKFVGRGYGSIRKMSKVIYCEY